MKLSRRRYRLALTICLLGMMLGGCGIVAFGQTRQQPLWQPPVLGSPLELSYLPDGVQAVVAWRAAEFLAHDEAQKFMASLGPLGEWLQQTLPDRTGIPLADCERVVLGLSTPSFDASALCVVIHARERLQADRLSAAWRANQTSIGSNAVFVSGDTAYALVNRDDGGTIFVMCPRDEIGAILARSASSPTLSRELEELRLQSNQNLQWVVLSPANFWLHDGDLLSPEHRVAAREWFDWFFAGSARAILFSANVNEHLFVETRVTVSADQPVATVARAYRQRLADTATRVEARLEAKPAAATERELLARSPKMLSIVDQFTRSAVQGRQVVFRTYLPQRAAHNLVLAARLFLENESK